MRQLHASTAFLPRVERGVAPATRGSEKLSCAQGGRRTKKQELHLILHELSSLVQQSIDVIAVLSPSLFLSREVSRAGSNVAHLRVCLSQRT